MPQLNQRALFISHHPDKPSEARYPTSVGCKRKSFSEEHLLQVGQDAPDFTVTTHEGQSFRLSSLRGHKVLLWFYPKANTSG